MKKTMFITSVIMVVVLAIALTTSSLAWFSAGGATSVSTTELSVAATTTVSAGAGIEISPYADGSAGWTTAAVTPETLQSSGGSALNAMCPVGYTSKASISEKEFYAAVNAMQIAKVTKEDVSGTMQTVFSTEALQAGQPYVLGFALHNSGVSSAFNAACSISLTTAKNSGSQDATIWVAVFDKTTSGEEKLLALLGKNNNVEVSYMTYALSTDSLAHGQLASAITGSTGGVPVANIDKSAYTTLEAGTENASTGAITSATHEIEVYIWYDGDLLTNQSRATTAQITISFTQYNNSGSGS